MSSPVTLAISVQNTKDIPVAFWTTTDPKQAFRHLGGMLHIDSLSGFGGQLGSVEFPSSLWLESGWKREDVRGVTDCGLSGRQPLSVWRMASKAARPA